MGRTKKLRGNRTHGRGKKAGRGPGKRGGRGNAGLHKHKFMSMIKYFPNHFGDRGFKRHPSLRNEIKTINVGQLEENLAKLIHEGHAKETKAGFEVDLHKKGRYKLLGGGRINSKMKVVVDQASKRARKSIEEAGGEIFIYDESKEKKDG